MSKFELFLEKKNISIKEETKRFLVLVVSTIIYGIGVAYFLEASTVPIYSGGVTGIAQLIRDFILVYFNVVPPTWVLSIIVIGLNIPIFILGLFGVSKRFMIYSIISVLIQSYVLGFLPIVNLGLNAPEHALACAVLGGLLTGIGASWALKKGMSTGGFDIISQLISFKKHVSVGYISLVINVGIALIGGFLVNGHEFKGAIAVGGVVVSYTIIRIIVSTLTCDKIHTAYNYLAIQIITDKPEEISEYIMNKVVRGVTMLPAIGAFSKKTHTMLYIVINAFELHRVSKKIKEIDPNAFIISSPVSSIQGNFFKRPVA
ncbi:MAG: YitT family protein [Acholeplasmatales bacterium]|jgi:uncharacterized membrane-anchored protein YitT (DUF2179 family)|nr:YitT family protein [Acholeplasmatales bacterium]